MGLFQEVPILKPRGSSGVSAFTALTDVPASYAGAALKVVRVNAGGTGLEFATVSGTGDVVGPAGATDNRLVRFDGATGKLIQTSAITVDDTGIVSSAILDNSTTMNIKDSLFTLEDNGDATKQMAFQLSGITAGNLRTITIPDASGTMTILGNTTTGSGSIVLATSPTLVTPVLGVASATSINKVTLTAPATGSTLTIADGKTLTISNTFTATATDGSTVAFGAGGTVAYVANKLSVFAATTSAEFITVISDETGSGFLVFATSPTLITPVLGVASATSINKVTITAPAAGSTLTIADGKTLTVSNTLTFTGTDASSVAFGSGGTVVYTTDKLSVHAATTSAEFFGVISDETGSGKVVGATAPSMSTITSTGTAPLTLTQDVATSGSPTALTVTGGAHTTLTASNEAISVNYNLAQTVQFATGALTNQRAIYIQAPTYAFVGSSTITTAATLAISGAPTAGTNAIITVPLALSVEGGDVRFTGTQVLMNGANPVFKITGTASASQGLIFQGNVTAAGAGSEFVIRGTATRTNGDLLRIQNNATAKVVVNWDAGTTFTQSVNSSGSPALLTLTGAAHTTLTAAGSFTDISFALARTVQMATGAVTFAKVINITAPTLGFVGASTVTDAATVYISGAPSAGTNATITSQYGLYVAGGLIGVTGDIRCFQQNTEWVNVASQTSTTFMTVRGNQSAAGTGSDVRLASSATRTAGDIVQVLDSSTKLAAFAFHGGLTIFQKVIASATGGPGLKIAGAAHTALTLSSEVNDVYFNLARTVQFATGALATQRAVYIDAPTYAFVGASTLTNAATFAISGPPVAGANATLTNTHSLWVQTGTAKLDGRLAESKGADVASAGTLTLGADGNVFALTGTTAIDYITKTGWYSGNRITLLFSTNITLNHNTGSVPGTALALLLSGAANFAATANDSITFVNDGTGWREVSRTVI